MVPGKPQTYQKYTPGILQRASRAFLGALPGCTLLDGTYGAEVFFSIQITHVYQISHTFFYTAEVDFSIQVTPLGMNFD